MKKQNKKPKQEVDSFFVLGICFAGISPVFIAAINKAIGLAFLAMGVSFMIIGIKNNKK